MNMKKILFLLFIGLFFQQAKAQYVGIKGGYNYASLSGDVNPGVGLSRYHGFYGGVTMDFPLSNLFFVQTEGLYTRIGGTVNVAGSGVNVALDYISVPVLLGMKVYERLSAQVGPQFNFLAKKSKFSYKKNEEEVIVEKAFDNFDLSLGIGLKYTTSSGYFVEARFNQGLTNIADSSNESLKKMNISSTNNFKNSYISIGMGYRF